MSGPLCRRASSAAKSVRHNPALAMLAAASRLSARWLLINTSQSRGAVMEPFFFTISYQAAWGEACLLLLAGEEYNRRSTEAAPAPRIIRNVATAIVRRWYS